MKIADVLLLDYDAEIGATLRILKSVPDDKAGWKPHEKSTSIEKLALHIATVPRFGVVIMTKPGFDIADPAQKLPVVTYTSTAETIAEFERNVAAARAALVNASDADLEQKWKFSFGERVIGEMPRMMSWRLLFFNHMMHHRSQLGVYLRLLDIPVPATYGPSADDRMGF
jgi:uncharacterized damage-inducible protein DinB